MSIKELLPAAEILRSVRSRMIAHGIILMYHRIGHSAYDPWQLCVSPENFAQQLEVLRDHAEIVPLSQLPAAVEKGLRRKPPVAITFDDGYADNYHNAWPILERYGVPATLFISTGFVRGGVEFWSDRLARIVLGTAILPDVLQVTIGDAQVEIPTQDRDRTAVLNTLWRKLRPLHDDEQNSTIESLQRDLGTIARCDAEQLPLTVDQIARLSRSPLIEIGAHTRSHCQLTSRSPADQMAEILNSKTDCEAMIGKSVTQFAYPYGWYDGVSIECARWSGFTLACSTVAKPVTRRADRFALPRFAVKNINAEVFERCFALRFCSVCTRTGAAA